MPMQQQASAKLLSLGCRATPCQEAKFTPVCTPHLHVGHESAV